MADVERGVARTASRNTTCSAASVRTAPVHVRLTPRSRSLLRAGAVLALALALIETFDIEESRSAPRSPTYAADVAPILMRNCVGCHRGGGIAPFPLLTYEDAKSHAAQIADATRARRMPPFNLDNSGTCNTYKDARWLDDSELATISSWVAAGTPLGDSTRVPPAPPPPPSLDRVDRRIEMELPYTPDPARQDDYRCFVIDPRLDRDEFVTGFQVHPGDPRMVHHLTLFALDTDEAEHAAAELDAAEAGPGYTCFGDTRVESRWLVGSGPGSRALELPEGTGLRMRAGRKTVLQMHYSRAAGSTSDRTTIDLRLAPSVPVEAFIGNLANYDIAMPPGIREARQTAMMIVPESVTLWGLWPHMHLMGTKLEIAVVAGGGEQCLARVDDWNFHWQGFANYTKPIALSKDDILKITCTYDTTSARRLTTWGSSSDDEMCIAFLYMTPRDNSAH